LQIEYQTKFQDAVCHKFATPPCWNFSGQEITKYQYGITSNGNMFILRFIKSGN